MEWKPEFDSEFAEALVGKHVLVGITDRERETDKVTGHGQFHGVVISDSSEVGIVVQNPTTKSELTLPPLRARTAGRIQAQEYRRGCHQPGLSLHLNRLSCVKRDDKTLQRTPPRSGFAPARLQRQLE